MHAFLSGGFFPPHCSLALEQKEGALILLSRRLEDGETRPAFTFSAVWLAPPQEHLLCLRSLIAPLESPGPPSHWNLPVAEAGLAS